MSRRSPERRAQPCAGVRRAPSFALSAALPMLAKLLIALIHVYQMTLSKLIVAVMGPVCRFEPSCSRYAAACILGHGALRGSLLSLKRLCRCHPFHPGGFDPPPPPRLRCGAAARMSRPRDAAPLDDARCSPTGTELASHHG